MRRASVVNVLRLSALCPAAWNCIYVLRCLGSNNIAWKKNVEQIIVFGVAIVFFLPFCAVCTHFPSRSLKIFIFFRFYLLLFFLFFSFFPFLVTQVKTFRKEYETRPYAKKKNKNPLLCVHRHRCRCRLPLLSSLLCAIWCRRHDRPPPLPQQMYVLVHGITWFWHKNSGDSFFFSSLSFFCKEKRKRKTHKPMSEYNGSSCISTTLFSHLIFASVFMLL